MSAAHRMRQYQRQAVLSASPELLIAKLYDLGVSACRRQDRTKVRAVLVELVRSLSFDEGGEIARQLDELYQYCLHQAIDGDLAPVADILSGLRDAWRDGVLCAAEPNSLAA